MSKTATVRARIEPDLKLEVEKLLDSLGLSTTEAINLFYRQIRLRRGLPFPVEVPNQATRRTFAATDRGDDLHALRIKKSSITNPSSTGPRLIP